MMSPAWFRQEGLPALRRRPWDGPQDARDGAFRDSNSEFEQLAVDARCSPQRIRPNHGLNQIADELANRGSSHLPVRLARQLRPISAETLPLPANHRVWVHQNQDSSPAVPNACQSDPKYPVRAIEPAGACYFVCRPPTVGGGRDSPGRGPDGLW